MSPAARVAPLVDSLLAKGALVAITGLAAVGFFVMSSSHPGGAPYLMVDELLMTDMARWDGRPVKVHGFVVPGSTVAKPVDRGVQRSFLLQKSGKTIRVFASAAASPTDQTELVAVGRVMPIKAVRASAKFLGIDEEGTYVIVADELLAKCPSKYEGAPDHGANDLAPVTAPTRLTRTDADAGGGWIETRSDHLSTFAADVDTAAYTIARRKLRDGMLPPTAGVRIEEFVNYFRYRFPEPAPTTPFAVVIDAAPSPLSPGRHILRVGVATRPRAIDQRKPAHLVFLVDVSGSMASVDRLGLAKRSLRILTDNLVDGDTVALVTYAGETRVVLPPTTALDKPRILDAIDRLESGGATAMASGIDLAYREAMKGLRPGAISRVIVLSDGDANVGAQTHEEILELIAGRAKEGVTLSTIGFGTGNYNDALMEQLADRGNGNNFYIDSIAAGKRVFDEQLGATLEVVAKDVKLQVDFDPAFVARYRLLGYDNRAIADSDFRADRIDAGEIGAGHQVTAMYELELTAQGSRGAAPLASLRIRHKDPGGEHAIETAFAMRSGPATTFAGAPIDLRFAFAVAAFAGWLRGGEDAEHGSLEPIRDLAKRAAADDADRTELVGLIETAMTLGTPQRGPQSNRFE